MRDAAVRHFSIAGAVVAMWCAVSAGADAGDLRLLPLTQNVYAVLQPHDQRYNDANSLIVIGDEAVAVVDAQARPAGVAQVIAFVRQLTQLPVKYVINTHWHADHTQGNAAWRASFGETVQFVGHDSLFDDVPERAAKDLRERVAAVTANIASAEREIVSGNDENGDPLDAAGLARQRAGIERAKKWLQDNKDARFLFPDVAYHKRLRLSLGGIDLELLHFKAHTGGDTVVWLPAQRVLASGDLLDDLPYVGHGFPHSWHATLDALAELDAAMVVPGHGEVFRDDKKRLAIAGFLTRLMASVSDPQAQVQSAQALADSGYFAKSRAALAQGEPTAEEFFDAVLVEAIERTRATAKAAP